MNFDYPVLMVWLDKSITQCSSFSMRESKILGVKSMDPIG
jgi:hypothetical protein